MVGRTPIIFGGLIAAAAIGAGIYKMTNPSPSSFNNPVYFELLPERPDVTGTAKLNGDHLDVQFPKPIAWVAKDSKNALIIAEPREFRVEEDPDTGIQSIVVIGVTHGNVATRSDQNGDGGLNFRFLSAGQKSIGEGGSGFTNTGKKTSDGCGQDFSIRIPLVRGQAKNIRFVRAFGDVEPTAVHGC